MNDDEFDEMRKQNNERTLNNMLTELLRLAEATGFVITVETKPLQPLAMRNYKMVGEIRRAR